MVCTLCVILQAEKNKAKQKKKKNELPIAPKRIACEELPIPKNHVYTILLLISHFKV